MPIVTENRLKGNYGAALVMSRLSGECLVRPVAADTDVGVDLYCETVAEGRPFLHFWLQVKAGDQCKRDASSNAASCSFELDHLKYWTQQPVPVFAALVPAEWPVLCEPDIYIVRHYFPDSDGEPSCLTTGHHALVSLPLANWRPSLGTGVPALRRSRYNSSAPSF